LLFQPSINDMGWNAGNYDTVNCKISYRLCLDTIFNIKGWPREKVIIMGTGYATQAGYDLYASVSGNPAPTLARHLAYVDAGYKISLEFPGVKFFDVYRYMATHGGPSLTNDGVHPNNVGSIILANGLYAVIAGDGYLYNPGFTQFDGETRASELIIPSAPITNQISPLRFEILGSDTSTYVIPGGVRVKGNRMFWGGDTTNKSWLEFFIKPPGYTIIDSNRVIKVNTTATPQSGASLYVSGNVSGNGNFGAFGSTSTLTIGTSSPSNRVMIQMNTGGVNDGIRLNQTGTQYGYINMNSSGADHAWIWWGANTYGGTGVFAPNAFSLSQRHATGAFNLGTLGTGPITFSTNGDATSNERMRITSVGRIGIGTNAPDSTVHIVGSENITGNVRVQGNENVRNVRYTSTVPTVTLGLGAGTSPSFSASGCNQGFRISFTVGATPAANDTVFTFTYSGGYTAPNGTVCGRNAINTSALDLTGLQNVRIVGTTTGGYMLSGSVALTPDTYMFDIPLIQY